MSKLKIRNKIAKAIEQTKSIEGLRQPFTFKDSSSTEYLASVHVDIGSDYGSEDYKGATDRSIEILNEAIKKLEISTEEVGIEDYERNRYPSLKFQRKGKVDGAVVLFEVATGGPYSMPIVRVSKEKA